MPTPQVPFLARTKVLWTGEEDGDLGFLENETVKVLYIVDNQWWLGLLARNGSEGIFPKDFVEVIESNPPTPTATPKKAPKAANVAPKMASAAAKPASSAPKTRREYSQMVLSQSFTESPKARAEPSPKPRRDRKDVRAVEEDGLLELITQKKQQLEQELSQLRRLERTHLKSLDLSYVSEDMALLRKGTSREDLGNKLAHDLDSDDAPPPPPKHQWSPFDADDFRALEDRLKQLLKSLQSDVLNLLELSATLAGSFMRHKHEREMLEDVRLARLCLEPKDLLMSLMFRDLKKSTFFGFMKKKEQEDVWEQKLAVNRMKSLSLEDKQSRTKAAVRAAGNFIVKPLEHVTDINVSETYGEGADVRFNARKVLDFCAQYGVGHDLNELISDISVRFAGHRVNQIRAAVEHLCQFAIVEEPERISQAKPRLAEVMRRGEATVFQLTYLLKKLLEALRIPSEVVLGFWKKPNEFYHHEQYVINHCWLLVLVEGERGGAFRMVDLVSFQNGAICNLDGRNEFYFLAEPKLLVLSHIPSIVELQHVCPPVDLNIAFHLPRLYLGFAKYGLAFDNFNNALTLMRDNDIFQTDVLVPVDVELFALVKTPKTTSNDYTLCQVRWVDGVRVARVKALLPDSESIGVLQLFAGPKGLQTHFDNIHELACVVPLQHSGVLQPARFVPRFPTIQAQNNDLYVRQPQVSALTAHTHYNFEVLAHPLRGLNLGSGLMNRDFRMVVELPSGKYTRLVKDDGQPHGAYRANIQCADAGTYRALVVGDSGGSWHVFAQWDCVA